MPSIRQMQSMQAGLTRLLQECAKEGFLVVTTSVPYPGGRGRNKRPLVLGPTIVAADPDYTRAFRDLVGQAKRRDGNTIYGFTMTLVGSHWLLMGTPAISEISLVEV